MQPLSVVLPVHVRLIGQQPGWYTLWFSRRVPFPLSGHIPTAMLRSSAMVSVGWLREILGADQGKGCCGPVRTAQPNTSCMLPSICCSLVLEQRQRALPWASPACGNLRASLPLPQPGSAPHTPAPHTHPCSD